MSYDKNFTRNDIADENSVVWYEVTSENVDLYGLIKERDEIMTHRMPQEIAKKVNPGVDKFSRFGSGGRIRFSTNSPYVAIKVEYGYGEIPTSCNHCATYGFALYVCDEAGKETFKGIGRPVTGFDRKQAEYKIDTKNSEKDVFYTLYFPVFSEVERIFIGFEKGSSFGKGFDYVNSSPVVFYGSSITHGGPAGSPGNTYVALISQEYNLNVYNLGFSGNAKGEQAMAEYIASLDMTAFVCDYDYNTPDADHLRKTYYPFYETIRKKHPDIPYIMVTAPNYMFNINYSKDRADVIYECYLKAVENGDKNVYFIHGKDLFEGDSYYSCTIDGVHPNDLGYLRMSEKIGSLLNKVLTLR